MHSKIIISGLSYSLFTHTLQQKGIEGSPSVTLMVEKKNGMYLFLVVFVLTHLICFWLPQYSHNKFSPTQVVTQLDFNGGDLLAIFVSAKRLGVRDDVRQVVTAEDKKEYPYPIGDITNSYGGLSLIAMWPFTHFSFGKVRLLFFFLSIGAIYFLIRQTTMLTKHTQTLTPLVALTLLVLSGPIALLLERGNIEVFEAILLIPFFIQYVRGTLDWKGSTALGLAIHIKLWPLIFLPLLIYEKKYRLFAISLATFVFSMLIASPLVPIDESIRAIISYNNAAATMWGWISITLFSAFKTMGFSPDKSILPITSMVILQLLIGIVYLLGKFKTNEKQRLSIFAMAIVTALLCPAFVCEYNIINLLLVLIPLVSRGSISYSVIFAILLVNGLAAQEWLGPIKALALCSLFALLLFDSIKSKDPSFSIK